MQQVRCAMGGMAATPALAKHVAMALEGKAVTLSHLQQAAEQITLDFQPLSDVRASSAYRLQVSKNLFSRIYYQTLAPIQLVESDTQAHQDHTVIQTRVDHASL